VKYLDEYRDPTIARGLFRKIRETAGEAPLKFMEVCGGHTYTIYRHGIDELLPENLELVHGPGCPVCVMPMGRVDDALAVAGRDRVIFTTYGDMMRVPGSELSLLEAKGEGADVRFVYSPLDALRMAAENPDREVVFFAIGFETTAPATAATLLRARDDGIRNFSVLCNHVTILPAIKAILDSPGMRLDGFVGPGHVSTIIGVEPYRWIAREYGRPVVIAGFEPLDFIQSVLMLVRQVREGRCEVENQYGRVVRKEGNPAALAAIHETMELRAQYEWRGLGFISHSALRLRHEFEAWDAEKRYDVPGIRVADPKACQCGEVLKGVIKPWECRVFGTRCHPESPMGSPMVSAEGACAAAFKYGRFTLRQRALKEEEAT
jgi:hydrogenase expression/formation protein HypD